MTRFKILNRWRGQDSTCLLLCAVVLLGSLHVVEENAFKPCKSLPMEVTAGGKDLGEIPTHQVSVSCY